MKTSLDNLKTQLRSRRVLTIAVPALMVIIFVASVALTQMATAPKGNTPKPQTAAEYQKSLKASVDNTDGSPVSGRSPANQAQTSLASAASTPSGTGTRTEKVASAVTGTTGSKVTPNQVYSAEQQKTGINDAGKPFYLPSDARKGDYVELLAEIDCLVAVSACPGGSPRSGKARAGSSRRPWR